MSSGQDETRVCGYIYNIYIYIYPGAQLKIFQGTGGFAELGHFKKHKKNTQKKTQKNTRKKAPQGKFWSHFS